MAQTYTDNLRIAHLQQNVAQPEIPENTAKNIIDNILSNVYTLETVDALDITITHSDDPTAPSDWQSFMIEIKDTGTFLTADIDVILPDNARPYIFKNSTTYSLTFKTAAGTGFLVNAGNNAYAFSDGTDISKLEFAATGSGTTLVGLNDTPAAYDNTKVLQSTASGTQWYDIVTALAAKLDHTGGTVTNYGETSQTVTSTSNATTINLSSGNVVLYTSIENTTFTFTTTHTNTSFTLLGTNLGANSEFWPAALLWEGGTEPDWSISGKDLVTFTKIGTDWIGGALIGVA